MLFKSTDYECQHGNFCNAGPDGNNLVNAVLFDFALRSRNSNRRFTCASFLAILIS